MAKKAAKELGEPIDINNLSDDQKSKLPHLYGWPWYQWAWDFFVSRNRFNFITAANQISKSSTMIRKCIHWATADYLWLDLWETKPTQFWYFYPSKDLATKEFDQKWIKEFLPRDELINDPIFGWTAEYRYKQIYSLSFNSGVTIYFMSYEQSVSNLQAASVYSMFCDEEIPLKIYDESYQRISAVQGYFHSVFTATLGQRFWYETMELQGKIGERFPKAFKRQVSKYDCLTYMDGSASPWTIERIRADEDACSSEAEKLKRIHGRFVMDNDLLFGAFDSSQHSQVADPKDDKASRRKDWLYWSGVYFGKKGRGAVVIARTSDDIDKAEIIDCWAGDCKDKTALEVFLEYQAMAGSYQFSGNYCDIKARDFITLTRGSMSQFDPHRMPQDRGDKLINSLFRCGVLTIRDHPRTKELILQLMTTLKRDEDLNGCEAVGALITALRPIPWNISHITNPRKVIKKKDIDPRLAFWTGSDRQEQIEDMVDLEISMANEESEFYGYQE